MCKQSEGKRNPLSVGMKPVLHWRQAVGLGGGRRESCNSVRKREISFLFLSLNEIELFIARQLL